MAKRSKKRKKKQNKRSTAVWVILISVLVVIASLFAVVRFVPSVNIFPVKHIAIVGETTYTPEEVIAASGIKVGTGIFKISFNKSEENIKSQLPYVKEAKISYALNGELTVEITSEQNVYSIKKGADYYLLNENFKILDSLKYRSNKTIFIYGVSLYDDHKIGEIGIDTANENLSLALSVIKLLQDNGININVIDVQDENDIKLVYDDRFIVELGTDNYLEDKIKMLSKITFDLSPNETGRILLKYWSEEDRLGSVLNENIDEYLNKY